MKSRGKRDAQANSQGSDSVCQDSSSNMSQPDEVTIPRQEVVSAVLLGQQGKVQSLPPSGEEAILADQEVTTEDLLGALPEAHPLTSATQSRQITRAQLPQSYFGRWQVFDFEGFHNANVWYGMGLYTAGKKIMEILFQ